MQYEIRAMSLGELLDTGFQLVRNHFVQLVSIAAIVYVPLAVMQAIFTAQAQSGGAKPSAVAITAIVVAVLGFAVLSPIVTVAITYTLGEVYQGRTTTVGEAMRQAVSILLPLLGTSLLSGLLVAVGLLLLAIPGIWLLLGLIALSQVMIFERRFGMAAIKRSLELLKGHRMRAGGVLLVGGLVTSALGFAFNLVAGFVPYAGPIASGLASAVGNTFLAAVSVVLYFDIRCRKEAFEIEHLSRLVRADGPRQAAAR